MLWKWTLPINCPRVDSANSNDLQITEFPRFPLNQSNEQFEISAGISGDERSLLEKLQADDLDDDKVNEIERKTRSVKLPRVEGWKKIPIHCFEFWLDMWQKKKPWDPSEESAEPQTCHFNIHKSWSEIWAYCIGTVPKIHDVYSQACTGLKSGLVISSDSPYLGASPDGKVVDPGCSNTFGLSEIKFPETKYLVTPLDACWDSNFFLEVNGMPKLKRTHKYYTQVQGLIGVTGARWCDFVVYTSKGMSIECIPFDVQFWNDFRETLKLYYFRHFLALAAKEP